MANSGTGGRSAVLLGIVLLLCLAGAAGAWFVQGSPASDSGLDRFVATAQSITLRVPDALGGNAEAFDELERRAGQLPEPAAVAAAAGDVQSDAVRRGWGGFRQSLTEVLAERDAVIATHDAAASVEQRMPGMLTQLGDFFVSLDAGQRAAAEPVIDRFELVSRSIVQDMKNLSAGVGDRDDVISRLNAGDEFVNQMLRGFAGADDSLGLPAAANSESVAAVNEYYFGISETIRAGIESSAGALDARRAGDQLRAAVGPLYVAAGRAAPEASSPLPGWLIPALLGAAALAGLGLMLGRREEPAQVLEFAEGGEQNDKNQEAILRLLDEMGSLADGDLTVEATVTEDITGAIADSINYAIEALRGLVSTIDRAASEVETTAQQTEAMSSHLAKSSENQSRQVFSATESIANMAGSIEEVSGNAERSADVARHSVEIAHKGGEAVRRTIDGMNTIRETIQDTSKRIKRLGESSQEIGNIVELINDIAEQTNILALNASIQASMAGEAGRGFAVVADEVQRLSERCTNATKQIEVLVKTIQSDTNEAVVSMERSTTDVVSGALLAENAGAALDEIEKVSNQIASLVQNISGTARQQATAAADITRNMGVLQEISAQSAENTSAASRSIAKLAEMASELRRSVAGFTLPQAGAESKNAPPEPLADDEARFIEADELLAEVGDDR